VTGECEQKNTNVALDIKRSRTKIAVTNKSGDLKPNRILQIPTFQFFLIQRYL